VHVKPIPIKNEPKPEPDNVASSSGKGKGSSKKRKKGTSEASTSAVKTEEVKPELPKPKPAVKPEDMPPKPKDTYNTLSYRAIKAYDGKATLGEICAWMMDTHLWYRLNEGGGWEASLKQHLAAGSC
jgi:forkhead box protein K